MNRTLSLERLVELVILIDWDGFDERYLTEYADCLPNLHENIAEVLREQDKALGRLRTEVRQLGLRAAWLFVTDHGLTDHGKTKLPALVELLGSDGLRVEVVGAGRKPRRDTEIVIAPGPRAACVILRGRAHADDVRQRLHQQLLGQQWVEHVLDREAIAEHRGADVGDLVVEPSPPWSLAEEDVPDDGVRAGHGSLRERFVRIIGSWPQEFGEPEEQTRSVQVVPTIAELLGVRPPRHALDVPLTPYLQERALQRGRPIHLT
jgi:arylsulfatase A-like enzyme